MRKQKRQSHESRGRAGKRKPANSVVSQRLRVLIASASPLTAEGLVTMLRAVPEIDVLQPTTLLNWRQRVENSTADVLIVDADPVRNWLGTRLHGAVELVPTIVILDDPDTLVASRVLAAGIRGVLVVGFSGEELAAAARAVHAGLLVVSADLAEALSFPAELSPDDQPPDPEIEALTRREREVLALIAEGLLNKEIADRLKLSEHTVKFHVSAIMAKLGAGSRTEAAMTGIRRGLVIV